MSEVAVAAVAPEQGTRLYDLLIALTCIFSLLLVLGMFSLPDAPPEVAHALNFFDNIVCAIFFIDFILTLKRAKSRWRYLATWGWVDLLSCIPAVSIFRVGRLGRLLRLIRVFRVIKSTKTLWIMLFNKEFENTLVAIGAFALLTVAAGSCAILLAEGSEPGANILALDDALWWAFSTITTIGYGDRYPVTGYGRIIAVMLAVVGIGLIGLFTASLAAVLSRQQAQ